MHKNVLRFFIYLCSMQLTWKGSTKQTLAWQYWMDNETDDILFGGGKSGGKSWLGCSILAYHALAYPDTRYFIARAEMIDLRGSTSVTMRKVLDSWGLVKERDYTFNGQDNFWLFNNGSMIKYIAAKKEPQDPKYMRFGSMEFTQGWIEEAGDRIEREARNNLMVTLGRHNNDKYGLKRKLLQTCNPSKNYLYTDYYQPFKQGILEPNKKFIHALPEDNIFQPSGYLENLRKNLSFNERQRLLFGNWEYDDDPAVLCDYNAIMDCFTNQIAPSNPMRISADLAMKGRDRFVGGVWHGGSHVTVAIDQAKSDGKSIETDLNQTASKYKVGRSNIVADSDGLGNYLESYMKGINEFHGNAAASDKAYSNLKSECAYKLAEKINKRELKIVCTQEQQQRITDELGALKALDIDADERKKRIISKDEMKEQLGRSPDYLDMLIMGMYFEVIPKKASTFVLR